MEFTQEQEDRISTMIEEKITDLLSDLQGQLILHSGLSVTTISMMDHEDLVAHIKTDEMAIKRKTLFNILESAKVVV